MMSSTVLYNRLLLRHALSTSSLLLLLSVASVICAVSGLSCIQCVSLDKSNCVNGDMTPKPCTGEDRGSTYCLKSVGSQVSGHGHFVFRSCSKSLQTNCTHTYVHGDLYRVCHDSCIEDGCNGAASTVSQSNHMTVLIILTITVALLTL